MPEKPMKNNVKCGVVEALPSLQFKVLTEDGETKRAYLSGKMHKNFIRIVVGDTVGVEFPDTGEVGRIVKRY